MDVAVDVSDEDTAPDVGIAPDCPGNRFELRLPGLVITINYEQLESLYVQLRPWFDE